jgi:hypothetical protein
VRRAGGRGASGGRCQQAGQERIFLAHGFVGDDGDLTVAGRGDEGDDPSTLEEAEDALAGALDDGKDVLLGKFRCRVEDGGCAVAPRGVRSIELENMKMR